MHAAAEEDETMERNNRKERGQFSLVEAKKIFVLRRDSSLGRLTD